jgi:hypothetical protein
MSGSVNLSGTAPSFTNLTLGAPKNITVLLPALNQSIDPVAISLSAVDKVNAEAFMYVDLAEMRNAFKVKVTQENDSNYIRYFVDTAHLKDLGTVSGTSAMNPAYAVVEVGATTWLSGNGSVLSQQGRMVENDYIRNLAVQLLGNPNLTTSFTNISDVLADVQSKCSGAMGKIATILKSIDATNGTLVDTDFVQETEEEGGNYYFQDESANTKNICKLLWQSIMKYAPERLSQINADGTFQSLPFIDGDSFKFEIIFDNVHNTGIPDGVNTASTTTTNANPNNVGNQSSVQQGVAPRNYYIRYVMRDLSVAASATQYATQPSKLSSISQLNWFLQNQ